jgi:hypothetical protein
MATRHRIPSIFNLSMVDVLCCALGCVILLWLLNLRQAKQSGNELTHVQAELSERTREADDLRTRLDDAEQERDKLKQTLALQKSRLEKLNDDVSKLRSRKTELEEEVAAGSKTLTDQGKQLTAARRRGNDLDLLLKEKEADARKTSRTIVDLEARLRKADISLKELREQGDSMTARASRLEKDLAGASRSLRDSELVRTKLTRDLAARDRELASATGSIDELRSEMERRFAGIALTGKNVVFLVDMSGSMELVDSQTSAPNKWVGVRETLAKVMRSLPSLEKYQVILFSDKVLYPLGQEDGWLTADPKSANQVLETLADKKYKPKGGTNMYAAFEAAFRLRARGLDTIYLFSDGLPNQGAGLTAEQAANLKTEVERAEVLSKHIRKTLAGDWNRPLSTRPRVRINGIGFFYESPDVGAFLWALARENDGSFVGMSKP